MTRYLEQQQLEEISREQREMEREQLLDAIDRYGDASVRYGQAIMAAAPPFDSTVRALGRRKDQAYEELLKLVNRRLS